LYFYKKDSDKNLFSLWSIHYTHFTTIYCTLCLFSKAWRIKKRYCK